VSENLIVLFVFYSGLERENFFTVETGKKLALRKG
jgi:hypothetical protein